MISNNIAWQLEEIDWSTMSIYANANNIIAKANINSINLIDLVEQSITTDSLNTIAIKQNLPDQDFDYKIEAGFVVWHQMQDDPNNPKYLWLSDSAYPDSYEITPELAAAKHNYTKKVATSQNNYMYEINARLGQLLDNGIRQEVILDAYNTFSDAYYGTTTKFIYRKDNKNYVQIDVTKQMSIHDIAANILSEAQAGNIDAQDFLKPIIMNAVETHLYDANFTSQ